MSPRHLTETLSFPLALLVAVAGSAIANNTYAENSIADYLAKPSLNVVITVSDMEAATKFYGEVMGLKRMPPVVFGETTAPVFFPRAVTMERFQVGGHEIKLIPGVESTKHLPKGVDEGIGFRMINVPIPDIEQFKKRLDVNGYDETEINAMPGSAYRFGIVEDPDGNPVEFYYYDGAGPPGWQQSLQIALTVSDVEASREFYGKTLGMNALAPVPMPGNPDRKVHLFTNGPTLIKFWSHGEDLPNHAGRHLDAYGYRYIQYHTKDVHGAHDFVKARGASIDMPPTAVKSMPVDIMFVADPDGIINEMFGVVIPGN